MSIVDKKLQQVEAAMIEKDQEQDVLELLSDTMTRFREEMQQFDNMGTRIAARTRFILRSVYIVMILSSCYLVFMILQMSNSMNVMTTHLENMYSSFGTMSQDMHEITRTVDAMDKSIYGLPVIAGSMAQMDGNVGAMTDSVSAINHSMAEIDNDMTRINTNMHEMTGKLHNMNRSVNSMGYDVNEMAAPMNIGPMSNIWPR